MMKYILFSLIVGIAEVFIFHFYLSSIEEYKNRNLFFIYTLTVTFWLMWVKIVFADNKIVVGISVFVSFLFPAWGIIKIAGISFFHCIAVICANIAISMCVDMVIIYEIVYLTGNKNAYPDWESPYALVHILFSNLVQVFIAYIYNRIRRRFKDEHALEKGGTNFFTWLIVISELVLFGICLSLKGGGMASVNLNFMILGIQIFFAGVMIYLIMRNFRNDEIRNMKMQIDIFERKNQLEYSFYQNLEQHEQKLAHIRHDFNNMMMVACTIAQNGQIEHAKKVFADMERLLEECEGVETKTSSCEKE